MRFSPSLLKGTTPGLILALLAERPMHGYELARTLEERSTGALALGQGVLYPALHRLERDGLIAGAWHAAPNGPERRVYRLTPQGHAALAERQAEWTAFAQAVGRVLQPPPPRSAPDVSPA